MAITHINDAYLDDLANVLEEEFPAIIESFINSSSKILDSISASLLSQDIESFTLKIHSLKGSCRNVGADHLAELCMKEETFAKNGQVNKMDPALCDVRQEFEIVKKCLQDYKVN